MRFPVLAVTLAALAAVLLLASPDAQHVSMATSPPNPERFSIDMDPANFPANTATSLGSTEPCAAMTEDNILNFDEDFVDTIEFDVTVTGIPAEDPAVAYTYILNYPAPETRITARTPMKITSPVQIPPDDLPDTDGSYSVSGVDVDPPYESGSGVLDRMRIEVLSTTPGVFPLTLSSAVYVGAYSGLSYPPDALDNAIIELNSGGCPLVVDIEIVSLGLTSANPVPIGVDTTVPVDESIRNNSPYPVNTDAQTTFTVPSGCTLNGATGTVVLNAPLGVLSGMATVPHQETPVLRCTTLGAYQMAVEACAVMDDPLYIEIVTTNNCQAQNVNFDVQGEADGAVSTAPFIGQTTVTANTAFPVIVQTSLSNAGPYSPADFTLSDSSIVPPACSVAGPAPGTHSLSGSATVVDQTWYVNCPPGGPYVIELDYALSSANPLVVDPATANNTAITLLSVFAEADADRDGVWDLDESNCGVPIFGVAYRPERVNGFDDDGDGQTDEALPPGSESRDCDGDGYTGAAEAHVFEAADRDQRECGTANWPADFVSGGVPESTDRVTITDLTSFLAPTRHIGTNVGDNPGNVRWDIVPGKAFFATDINIQDLTSLLVAAPAMFGGNRAFNGLTCGPLGCSNAIWCTNTSNPAGVELRLETDKLVYHMGEPVQISLTVTNTGADYASLNIPWGTCVASFIIDSWSSNCSGLPSCAIPEGCTSLLPPGGSFAIPISWNQVDASDQTVPRGDYQVMGSLAEDSCSMGACLVPTLFPVRATHYIRLTQ